jgi:octopine/nopaline transport system permease protein
MRGIRRAYDLDRCPVPHRELYSALCSGIPLTLQLTTLSVTSGALLAMLLASLRLSANPVLDGHCAGLYLRVPRHAAARAALHHLLRAQPVSRTAQELCSGRFCASPIGARARLCLNTAAYSAEIIRGGVLSVPQPGRSKRRALMA